MLLLILGLVLFLGIHSVSIVSPDGRNRLAKQMGEGPWKGLYSLVSLAGLVLIVIGYGAAREAPVLLYTPPAGLRHLARHPTASLVLKCMRRAHPGRRFPALFVGAL